MFPNLIFIKKNSKITHIANADGSLKAEHSYSAWGRLRNPATYAEYAPGTELALFFGRGYTGHEYLPWFGLVNMNFAIEREQYQTRLNIAKCKQKARSERPVI